jgi:hypothetical protein
MTRTTTPVFNPVKHGWSATDRQLAALELPSIRALGAVSAGIGGRDGYSGMGYRMTERVSKGGLRDRAGPSTSSRPLAAGGEGFPILSVAHVRNRRVAGKSRK